MGCFCSFRKDSPEEGEVHGAIAEPAQLEAIPRKETSGQLDVASSESWVSPFERALSKGHAGASPPKILFQAASPGNVVTPFDSATSSDFLSSAPYPKGGRSESTTRSSHSQGRNLRKRNSSRLDMALIGFDLDEHTKQPMGGSSRSSTDSQPPSPKTPQQSARSSDSTSLQLEAQYMDLDSARTHPSRNPLRGHPRFRKLKELRQPHTGSGSGGALTLLCRDEDNGQLCAIKFLRRASVDLDNAANEILHMRLCTAHPFVVHFKQAFLTPDYLAIAMEHTHSGNLAQYVATQSLASPGMGLSEDSARSFFQQLIVAVDYCHAMGIAHRDIRPENMLLVEPNDAPSLRSSCSGEDVVQPVGGLGRRGVPRLKLYGFHRSSGSDGGSPCGSSPRLLDDLASDDEAGPPQYLAPEASGSLPLDCRAADVWACGVLLHYMLTSALPDLDATGSTARAAYDPPRSISPEARRLLRRMLVANPERRASVAEVMQSQWFLQDCPEGLEDVDTELLILSEEGMLASFCEQSEAELRALIERACHLDANPKPSPYAVMGIGVHSMPRPMPQ